MKRKDKSWEAERGAEEIAAAAAVAFIFFSSPGSEELRGAEVKA